MRDNKIRKSTIFWYVIGLIILLWNLYIFIKLGGFDRDIYSPNITILETAIHILRFVIFFTLKWIIILLIAGTLLFALAELVKVLYKYLSNVISELNNWLDEKL